MVVELPGRYMKTPGEFFRSKNNIIIAEDPELSEAARAIQCFSILELENKKLFGLLVEEDFDVRNIRHVDRMGRYAEAVAFLLQLEGEDYKDILLQAKKLLINMAEKYIEEDFEEKEVLPYEWTELAQEIEVKFGNK